MYSVRWTDVEFGGEMDTIYTVDVCYGWMDEEMDLINKLIYEVFF